MKTKIISLYDNKLNNKKKRKTIDDEVWIFFFFLHTYVRNGNAVSSVILKLYLTDNNANSAIMINMCT